MAFSGPLKKNLPGNYSNFFVFFQLAKSLWLILGPFLALQGDADWAQDKYLFVRKQTWKKTCSWGIVPLWIGDNQLS